MKLKELCDKFLYKRKNCYVKVREAKELANQSNIQVKLLDLIHHIQMNLDIQRKLFFENQLDSYLQATSVLELNRMQSGVRAKYLYEAGYENLLQLKNLKKEDYLSIHGIGVTSVERIQKAYDLMVKSILEDALLNLYKRENIELKKIAKLCFFYSYCRGLYDSYENWRLEEITRFNVASRHCIGLDSYKQWLSLEETTRKNLFENAIRFISLRKHFENKVHELSDRKYSETLFENQLIYKDAEKRPADYIEAIILGHEMPPLGNEYFEIKEDSSKRYLDESHHVNKQHAKIVSKLKSFLAISTSAFIVYCLIVLFVHILPSFASYNDAIEYMEQEDYTDAKDIFDRLDEFKDSKSFSTYCGFKIRYDEGIETDEEISIEPLIKVRFTYNTEYEDEVAQLIDEYQKINDEVREKQKKQEEELREQIKKSKEMRMQRYKSKPPFLGMSEVYIEDTALGKPKRKEVDTDYGHTPLWRTRYYWGEGKFGCTFEADVSYQVGSMYTREGKSYEIGQGIVTYIRFINSNGVWESHYLSELED